MQIVSNIDYFHEKLNSVYWEKIENIYFENFTQSAVC